MRISHADEHTHTSGEVQMRLIFLYGPPGVGKLTVAMALEKMVGYRVFHNHLTFDLAAAFFEPFTPPFDKMMHALRLRCLELAADLGVMGATFTMCYDHPSDKWVVDDICRVIRDHGGEVNYVHLTCSVEEIKRRVAQPDRRKYRKLTRPEKVDSVLSQWNMFTPIEECYSLQIDNTKIPPDEVARTIISTFALMPPASGGSV